VIIEALCSGTPVIAADRGAIRETGGDSEHGNRI
jgi:glycosyltransferase involved in cell wall biosynthesis